MKEYADDFIDYIKRETVYKNKLAEKLFIMNRFNTYLSYVIEGIEAYIYGELDYKPEIDELNRIFADKLLMNTDNINNGFNTLSDFDDEEFISNVVERYRSDIIESVQGLANFDIDDEVILKSVELFKVLIKKDFFINDSGIVIAGYGENDIFPKLYSYNIEGIIDGRLRYKTYQQICIGCSEKENFSQATIIPFAQQEMVHLFIEGIDPNVQNKFYESIINICNIIPDAVSQISSIILKDYEIDIDHQAILDKYGADIDDVIKEVASEVKNDIDEFKSNEYIQPLLSAISSLPKEELAALAETLVNLTSVKRKMSLGMETVGGPIDVALITKGEGFIWIKRKHYFDPKLNQSFFDNYYRR